MKRMLLFFLTAAMVLSVAACKGSGETSSAPQTASSQTASTPSDGGLRMGLNVQSHLRGSKEAAEGQNGTARLTATVAAVILDGNGRIVDCEIDETENDLPFTAEGQLTDPTPFKTKGERGDSYGMKAASGIGKEWYEQINYLEDYLKGKTADQVAAVKTDENGYATDDLKAGCTIEVASYLAAATDACKTAQKSRAGAEDDLELSVISTVDGSQGASPDGDGKIKFAVSFAALAEEDDQITGCVVDQLEATLSITATGTITTDTEQTVQTKKQQGDAYGMKAQSPIGKEWYEQIAALESYVEKNGLPTINADGKAADPTLLAGCTIDLSDLLDALYDIQS